MTQPARNRFWQQVVKRKIANQSECLRLISHNDAAESLLALSKQVQ